MFLWTPDTPSPLEEQSALPLARMGTAEYFGRSVAHQFQRYNTLGLMAEDATIRKAEKEAGTFDEYWWIGGLTGTPETNRHAMPEEVFKAKGYDRGGKIAWAPHMTEQRAAILADTFDRRELESRLLDANSDTLGRKALGFGAGLLASLPDPINLIPMGGAMAKGASLGRRALTAGAEGVAGTVLADAALLPEARRRGEDVGFADFALDVTFGGLIGAGLGGVGGLLHNRRVKGLEAERLHLTRALTEAGYDGGEAGRLSSSVITLLADMRERRGLALAVRKSLAGMDRAAAGKLLDRVMIGMRDGEVPDVGKWARELGADNLFTRAAQIARERRELSAAYDHVRDHPLAGMPDEVLATITPEDIEAVLVHRGPAIDVDGEIVVQGRALRRAGLSRGGFGLVKIIFLHGEKGRKSPHMPRVIREDVLSLPQSLREYAPVSREYGINGDGVTRWNIPREDGNHLAIVVGRGQDGPDSRLVSMYVDGPEAPTSKKKNPSEVSSAAVSSRKKDTDQGISVFTPDGPDGLLNKTLTSEAAGVNELPPVVPDFTPPEPEPLITPPSLEEAALLEREALADEAGGPLDLEATRLMEEGRALPEDLEAAAGAQAELERVDKVEEAGLAVLECVLNVFERR